MHHDVIVESIVPPHGCCAMELTDRGQWVVSNLHQRFVYTNKASAMKKFVEELRKEKVELLTRATEIEEFAGEIEQKIQEELK